MTVLILFSILLKNNELAQKSKRLILTIPLIQKKLTKIVNFY
jgi:hypothetical protein